MQKIYGTFVDQWEDEFELNKLKLTGIISG
jgi:hypothetical protein